MRRDLREFLNKKTKLIEKLTKQQQFEILSRIRRNFIQEIDNRMVVLRKKQNLIKEALRQKKILKKYRRSVWNLITHVHFRQLLSVPFIYSMIIPALIMHLFSEIYHRVCFPLYRIPLVRSKDFFVFDRGHLSYLNVVEKFNCWYCSYFNGLISYITEIAGRTEKYWCPIKHARRRKLTHKYYDEFFEYLEGKEFREELEKMRKFEKEVSFETDPEIKHTK